MCKFCEIFEYSYYNIFICSGDVSSVIQQGSYESSTKNIVEKYKTIASHLDTATKQADSRYTAFSSSLKSIQSNLPIVLTGLKQRSAATSATAQSQEGHDEQLYFSDNSSKDKLNKRPTQQPKRKNSPMRSDLNSLSSGDKDDAAIDKLLEHLESN